MIATAATDIAGRLLPALAVIVAAPLAIWWWSRRHQTSTSRPVRVVARAGLGKASSVAVIAVGTRFFLIGAAEQSVTLLTEIDDDPIAGSPADDTDATRPRIGPIDRLREMTVRTSMPDRGPDADR